jgi:hypothetical protein
MGMVRDAVLHLHNEQPLLVDLFALPSAQDACVVCTNVRTMAGKRPLFVDRSDSFFLFPLGHIRFVEVPSSSAGDLSGAYATELDEAGESEPELEIDEDLMRRIRES